MKLSRFSNDEYKLLNYMKSIEINYKQKALNPEDQNAFLVLNGIDMHKKHIRLTMEIFHMAILHK